MTTKTFKPSSPGRRHRIGIDFSDLTKSKPEKKLTQPLRKKAGRNNRGKITVRHRGGGAKRRIRIIAFKRNKHDVVGRVAAIEYDPNRSANIALIFYEDGEKRYILAPVGLEVGQVIASGENAEISLGNALPLNRIPSGTMIHNIELHPGKGGQMIRGAGTAAQLLAREEKYTLIRLPSGEIRRVLSTCMATIGQVGNPEHKNQQSGKAGRTRWLGRRPQVRGSAMNPNDHPHGGGEGRSPIGHPGPKSPWGKPTLGKKTRGKKITDRLIVRRRK